QGNVAGELQRTACFVCEKHPVELCNILIYFIYPTRAIRVAAMNCIDGLSIGARIACSGKKN
ncbi:hypothetical protein S83_053530, partial [Arachis hypogaea]